MAAASEVARRTIYGPVDELASLQAIAEANVITTAGPGTREGAYGCSVVPGIELDIAMR